MKMDNIVKEIIQEIFEYSENRFDGFKIVTNLQTVTLGISNEQSCCENAGYFISEDDISDFIGSHVIKISIVDDQLKPCDNFDANNLYEGGVMFVNIETDNGLLQFVAYNEHNGYYGHDAIVESKKLKVNIVL